MNRRNLVALLLALGALALLVGLSGSSRAASPSNGAGPSGGPAPLVPILIANPLHPAPPNPAQAPATITNLLDDHVVDLGQLGIRPVAVPIAPQNSKSAPFGGLSRALPNGGAIGTQNAFMDASPDVISQTTTGAIGTLLSSFTPAETVNYYINGALAGSFAANANGVVAVGINTGAGLGYLTLEGIGATSGKRAGTVAQVLDAAPYVPGYAAAPHAVNETASGSFYAYGWRWAPNTTTTVSLYRNGVFLGNAATSANGRFFVQITPANSGDTAAIYTAISTTTGFESGASVEERADAGTPPQGDSNLARVLVDRPIIPATGGVIGIVGEGFQAGETVNITGCATGSVPATANGAVGVFLNFGAGSGQALCVFTGASSGRVGRGAIQEDSNAVNAPSAINAPANITTLATNFIFLFDRLLPNQNGTIYIDGVSQGTCTPCTNGSGSGSATLSAAGLTVGIHEAAIVGASGQTVNAPLYVIPAQGTATPTNTVVPTSTATATATATACTLSYNISVSAGAIITGTTDTGNHCDDCSTTITLPFPVTFYNQIYNTAIVGSNGGMAFVANNDAFTNVCLPTATLNFPILPYWDDQCTAPCATSTCTGCGIFTRTVGSTLYIEWRTNLYNTNTAENYEVVLTQGSPNFSVVYGPGITDTASETIGVQRDTGSNSTQYKCNTANPPITAGLQLNYTLTSSCFSPTPTGTATGTATRTVTVTNTPTNTPTVTVTSTPANTGTATATPGCGAPQSWQAAPSLTPGQYAIQGALGSDNNLYVPGGLNAASTPVPAQMARFNPTLNTWSLAAAPPLAAGESAVGAGNGKVFVAAGFLGGTTVTTTLEIYDIASNTWTYGASLPAGVEAAAGAVLNGKFYVIGGDDFTVPVRSTYIYDIAAGTWSTGPQIPDTGGRTNTYATTANGLVYVFGGATTGSFTAIDTLLAYNPGTNSWTTLASAGTGGHGNYGAISPYGAGKLLATDGADTTFVAVATTHIYDIASNTWSAGPTMQTPRAGHAQGTLPDGRVLVTNGLNTSSTTTTTSEQLPPVVPCTTATPTATSTLPPTSTATRTATAPPLNTATVTSTVPPGSTATRTVAPSSTATARPTNTVGPTATPCTLSFTDVHPTDYFYTPVLYLACHGVISGYNNGDGTFSFRPYNNTTRSQMVKIVVLGFNKTIVTPSAGNFTFTDVPPSNPFFSVIETAAANAIVSGYNCGGPGEPCDSQNRPYFRPYANVTRGQLSKIDVVAAGWALVNPSNPSFEDVVPNTAFYEFVETAYCHGIISGYNCGGPGEPCDSQNRPYFRQYNNATRGQIAKIVYLSVTGSATCGVTPTATPGPSGFNTP